MWLFDLQRLLISIIWCFKDSYVIRFILWSYISRNGRKPVWLELKIWGEITHPLPKFNDWSRWILGMDKHFKLTLCNGCNYLSILGLHLIHVIWPQTIAFFTLRQRAIARITQHRAQIYHTPERVTWAHCLYSGWTVGYQQPLKVFHTNAKVIWLHCGDKAMC